MASATIHNSTRPVPVLTSADVTNASAWQSGARRSLDHWRLAVFGDSRIDGHFYGQLRAECRRRGGKQGNIFDFGCTHGPAACASLWNAACRRMGRVRVGDVFIRQRV